MNLFFLKVFSFLVGLFISLFIINYINIENKKREKFEIKKLSCETFISNNTNTNNPIEEIPYKNFKYMCISSYYDIKQLNNTEGKWYDIDISNNKTNYFTYSKMINLKNNKINNDGSKGADLKGIELKGLKSFYYANNINSNELTEFSMIMSIRINEIKEKNNIIFEMVGNTEEIIQKNNINYTYSIININIQPNSNNNYNFILTIGNNVYAGNINNINKNIIRNTDLLILGLIYTESEITFLINKEMYKYKTNKHFTIKLGSMPLIINKHGNLNMELYNFTYYKSVLPINEYLKFFKHNYHYLSGINKVLNLSSKELNAAKKEASNNAKNCIQETKETTSININKRIDALEKNLGKCFDKNTDIKKKEEIKPFELKIMDNIKDTSSNFFNFLFE